MAEALEPASNASNLTVPSPHFKCQRCQLPLKLDASFEAISAHAYADITAPLSNDRPASQGDSFIGDSKK